MTMNIHVLSMHEAKYISVHVSVLDLDTWTLHFLSYIACVIDTNYFWNFRSGLFRVLVKFRFPVYSEFS
jgi:hypothetical protein